MLHAPTEFENNGSVLSPTNTQAIPMVLISFILLFVGIAVLILIHICIVARTIRRGLLSNVYVVGRDASGSTSMSRDDIEKLPCFDFKGKEMIKGIISPPADCAVCLENFSVGEKCRFLPSCKHSFHAVCVDLWLLRTPLCPICRAGANIGESGNGFGDSQIMEIGIDDHGGLAGV